MANPTISGTPSAINSGANYTPGSGSNRLVVVVARAKASPAAVTLTNIVYNGVTRTPTFQQNDSAGGNRDSVAICVFKESELPAGASAVTATWSAATSAVSLMCYTVQDANQSTPVRNSAGGFGNGATATAALGSITVGDLVLAGHSHRSGVASNNSTFNNSFTKDDDFINGDGGRFTSGHKTAAATTETYSVDTDEVDDWAAAAIAIMPVPSGLSGAAADVASASATLSTQIKLAATATDVASATAAVTTSIKLAMAAIANAAASGALTTGIRLAGTAADQVSATGALATGPLLSGAATDVATSVAALTTIFNLGAVASDAAVASGALTSWASVTLAGTLYTGQGGVLDPNFWVDSAPQLGTTVYYDPTHITIYPNGEISSDTNNCAAVVQFFDGTSWALGLIVITPQMAAVAQDSAAAAAQLSSAIQLAATASALATATAAFSTGAGLFAAATDTATASGSMVTGIPLSGLATSVSAAVAGLTAQIKLIAAAVDTVSADATLNGVIVLRAAANAVATEVGSLTTRINAAAAALSAATMVGSLTTSIKVSGVASDVASSAASLATAINLGGTVSNVVSATADLTTARHLVAAAIDVSTVLATLSTGIPLNAQAKDVTVASAVLTAYIGALGDAVSEATFTAVLTDIIESPPIGEYVTDPRFVVSKTLAGTTTVRTPRFSTKDETETAVLTFDFSDQLAPGEQLTGRITLQISAIAGIDANATSLFIGVPSYDSTYSKVLQPVQGGIGDCTYYLKVSGRTTSNERLVALSGLLPVVNA